MLERRASAIAGLTVAVMGVVPLVLLATSPPPQDPIPDTTAIAATQLPGLEASPSEVHVTSPIPEIAGVSDAVARVLAARGFATVPAAGEVPESVARLLVEHGVTLTVSEEG